MTSAVMMSIEQMLDENGSSMICTMTSPHPQGLDSGVHSVMGYSP